MESRLKVDFSHLGAQNDILRRLNVIFAALFALIMDQGRKIANLSRFLVHSPPFMPHSVLLEARAPPAIATVELQKGHAVS